MKVYTVYLDNVRGWTTDNADDFESELQYSIEESYSKISNEDMKQSINIVISNIKQLNVNERIDVKELSFSCEEIDEEVYNNLPEFNGW